MEELNTPLAPGSYTALTFCGNEGEILLYEPQVIEVTGVAPVDQLDLTVEEGTDRVTLAGSACTAGTVEVNLEATSVEDLFGGFSDSETGSGTEARRGSAGSAMMAPAPLVPESGRLLTSSSSGSDEASGAEARGAAGGLADDGFLEATGDTDAGGGWSITESAGFERGIVEAQATCGDPFADGFVYDDQIVEVDAATAEPPTSAPTTTLPAGPVATNPVPTTPGVVVPTPAAPANAVAGRPTYTG